MTPGWTRQDPPYTLRWGRKGCFIHHNEVCSYPCEVYRRPIHPEDAVEYGFLDDPDAKHEPVEEMVVIRTNPVGYAGSLTNGHHHVGNMGRYLRELIRTVAQRGP